ncbi:MAG: hypothetical protein J1F23_05480 [Oscillospiraceae bacterium]|nr:hypothetical protein [Oscillospiraceae bacterium]
MTESKPKRIRLKGLIAVAVIIAILLCGTLSANAATDGKLYTGVKALASADEVKLAEKVNDDDTFLSRIKITINGEEVSLDDYITAEYHLVVEGVVVELSDPDGKELEITVSGDPDKDVKITYYNIDTVSKSENWDEIVNAAD